MDQRTHLRRAGGLIVLLCCATSFTVWAQRAASPSSAAPIDWVTDGGDNQRTGWARNETTITKDNVKNLKLLWTMETENQPRALHSLMPALIIGQLNTPGGPRQVGIINGISDNLYGFDVSTGKMLWHKHWTYEGQVQAGVDPLHLGFLRPGGSSDTPVIGPPDAQGRRPVYFITGDGMLHTVNAADGEDLQPPFMFHTGKGWSLSLDRNVLWMANTYAQSSIAAVRLDDPQHKVMSFNSASGGAWGRRGAVIDSTGTAWTTTGDGIYDPNSNPPRYGNSVVGVHIVGDELQLKDYYTPTNWQWLQKRDLDPNNTPTIFTYKGRELMAASGKECRVYLLDPRSPEAQIIRRPCTRRRCSATRRSIFRTPAAGAHSPLGKTPMAPAGCWRRSGGPSIRR